LHEEGTHWFGKDVEDGVSDDFLVDIDDMATFGETPNTVCCQLLKIRETDRTHIG
jgi:hypothetical protein